MTVDSAQTRETNKQTLRRAMAAITALDADAIRAELHQSAVFELPFESAVREYANPVVSHAAIAKFADDAPVVSA
jgi:hypothetical protein